jgi:CHAT domain-containing protein/tetratricopeptide (TPR) repeat protein
LARAGELSRQTAELLQQANYLAAVERGQQACAAFEQIFPAAKYPHGHRFLAEILDTLGVALHAQGDYARALPCLRRALEMRQWACQEDWFQQYQMPFSGLLAASSLGPAHVLPFLYLPSRSSRFPGVRYALGLSLNHLGLLFHDQGEHQKAQQYLLAAHTLYEALYPPSQYPEGHTDLANSLNNLGASLYYHQGKQAEALFYYRQAVRMHERLYLARFRAPAGSFALAPFGGPLQVVPFLGPRQTDAANRQEALLFAHSLNNLSVLLQARGEYAEALVCWRRAVELYRTLYPKGHQHLAYFLGNMGSLFRDQGNYEEARHSCEQALAMCRALFPAAQYPQGHPALARSLYNLGLLHYARGEPARARPCLEEALAMHQQMAEVFAAAASEAEALNFAARLPLARDALLSVSRHLPENADATYRCVWRSKATVTRILERRQQSLAQASDPEDRTLWQELVGVRHELSRLLLAPAADRPERQQRVQQLGEQRESLDRRLAERLPGFGRQLDLERLPHTRLPEALPPNTVFLDLLRYVRSEQDPRVAGKAGWQQTPSYVGFVQCSGQPVQRVELGPAEPIESALGTWHRDLANPRAAIAVRALVWQPLAAHLPTDTRAVLLAPDGALTRLPWAALPGARPGTVLLEDYALGIVPHGPFLLAQRGRSPVEQGPGLLLVLGDVNYGRPPALADGTAEPAGFAHLAQRGASLPSWPDLPGTSREIDQVVARAGPRPVCSRRGVAASAAQLLADLPRARWVHLATHGFFADARMRSVLQVDPQLFEQFGFRERAAAGARNPFVLSGLVLAGANQPPPADAPDLAPGDGGLVTADAIAVLPLEGLELAVLSACETGLGEVAGGEGVFGLQRAFHRAGARTVLASLWRVDDEATQKLMNHFYENLWHRRLGKLEALRQAQLHLRRGDGARSRERGPGVLEPAPDGAFVARAHPRLWAAWVLSGDPGDLPVAAAVPQRARTGDLHPAGPGWLLAGYLGLLALLARYRRRPSRD